MIWPVCIGGMFAMFWYSWRLATAIALWVIPPTVLYMFYYWAPAGEENVYYLRFFLTVFPGMILAVPIIAVIKIVAENVPSLKLLEAMLSK